MAQGRNKVDLFVDTDLGPFGLLLVKQFGSVTVNDEFAQAIKKVLEKFSFPVLNIVSSASGKLVSKDANDLKVEAWLEELETRVTVKAFDGSNKELPVEPDAISNPLDVIGLFPSETEMGTPQEPPVQITPNISSILSAVGVGGPIAGIVSALGITLAPLFKPRPKTLSKTFRAHPNEFGWYSSSTDSNSQEGVHHTAAVLQVKKEVKELEVNISQVSDWVKGGVNNQTLLLTKRIKVVHPDVPGTPQLADLSSAASIPIVVPREDVRKLLAIAPAELDKLIADGQLEAFGANRSVITKGSLVNLLGIPQSKKPDAAA